MHQDFNQSRWCFSKQLCQQTQRQFQIKRFLIPLQFESQSISSDENQSEREEFLEQRCKIELQQQNMEQIKKLHHVVIKSNTYAVVEMQQNYPFATVHQATEQIVLVRKKLNFQNDNQLQIIQKMCDILYSLDHQNLVAFVHAQQSTPNTCSFFYQYVPLTIDKWLLDLGEDVLQQLQFQLTSLAGYLTGYGVKFNFDAQCVGLSKDIKIKYFLKEFSIDNQNKLANYKDSQTKIANFFKQLKLPQQQGQQKQEAKADRGSFESSRKVDSFQTRQSWGMQSCRSDGSAKAIQHNKNLAARLEDTKKRSLQLLARMKGLKGKMP